MSDKFTNCSASANNELFNYELKVVVLIADRDYKLIDLGQYINKYTGYLSN